MEGHRLIHFKKKNQVHFSYQRNLIIRIKSVYNSDNFIMI